MNDKLRELKRFDYVREVGFCDYEDGKLVYYDDVEKLFNTPKHESVDPVTDYEAIKGLLAFWRDQDSSGHYDILRDIDEIVSKHVDVDAVVIDKHETVEELRDLLTHMVNKSNKVTSMSRHGISSSQKSVNELYTAQLKAEKYLNGKPEIEG